MTVRSSQTKEPIAGARIWLYACEDTWLPPGWRWASQGAPQRTNQDGIANLLLGPEREVRGRVAIAAKGHRGVAAYIDPGENLVIRPPADPVRGVIVEAETLRPLPTAIVKTYIPFDNMCDILGHNHVTGLGPIRDAAETDGTGRFRLEDGEPAAVTERKVPPVSLVVVGRLTDDEADHPLELGSPVLASGTPEIVARLHFRRQTRSSIGWLELPPYMIGLLVTLNGQSPIAAAQAEDGVISAIVHIVCAEKEDGVVREARLEVGGLGVMDGGDRFVKWLHEALGPGDQIEVVIGEIERPTPWSGDLPWPDPSAECSTGVEVHLNDVVVGTKTAAQPNSVATVIVSWSRGAKTNPTPGEYIHLDVGLGYSKLLALGDTVLIRMLGG